MKITINNSFKKRGKHMSIEVKSQPIEHTFDDRKAARTPAKAIAKMVEERIKHLNKRASPKTIAKRQRQGRTSAKLFNDTGRLADGIVMAEGSPGVFETRGPIGRLSPDQPWLLERLLKAINIDPESIMGDPKVKAAVEETVRDMIKVKR